MDAQVAPSVPDIIKRAGGATTVASEIERELGPELGENTPSVEAVYKWPKIGIPDRYWPVLIRLAGVSAEQMMLANRAARTHQQVA